MPTITFKPRVKETSTTTGTGNITLAGAVVGYQSFDDAFAVTDDYFYYCIEAVDGDGIPTGQWEEGIGHLSASTTLVRDTLLNSSTGSAVSFSAGTKNVFCTVAARDFERTHSNVPKVYRAILSQTGTSAPTATVLENTLGGTVVWSRSDAGVYAGTLTGAFTADKTFFSILSDPVDASLTYLAISINRTSADVVGLTANYLSLDDVAAGWWANDIGGGAPLIFLTILVYP